MYFKLLYSRCFYFVIVGCKQLPLIFAGRFLSKLDRLTQVKHTHIQLWRAKSWRCWVDVNPLHLLYSALRCKTVGFYSFPLCYVWSFPHFTVSVRVYVYERELFCVTVQDPCADQNGGCMHECRADGGKAHCDCKVGYTLAADGKTCEGKLTSSE